MDVRPQPDVVGQVPADVVGIVVDHDLVAVPAPVIAEGVVGRRDLEGKAAKPETLPVSSAQAEDVARPEAAGEAPVLPGAIEVIGRIVAAGIVPDPAVAFGMDVRRVGMSGLIAKIARRASAGSLILSVVRQYSKSNSISTIGLTPLSLS